MYSMYSLTAMTGKEASASRTVVIGTVELNYRVWIILIWSTAPGLGVVLVLWGMLGQYAVLALPLVWAGAIFLLHRRSRSGLRLRTYQAMWDRRRSVDGQFFLCGQPLTVGTTDYRKVTANAVPYAPAPAASSVALADAWTSRPVVAPVTQVEPPLAVAAVTGLAVSVADPRHADQHPAAPASAPAATSMGRLDASLIGIEQADTLDIASLIGADHQERS